MAGTTLVTGATGFVGGHMLDRLADRAPLVAWYRPDGRQPNESRPIDWRPVDLTHKDVIARAIDRDRPARIFHLAGASQVATSWKNPVPHLRVNALGTHYLLDAIRRSGRECRVLVVSSAQIYQTSDEPLAEDAPLRPASPYGLSKLAQDQLALRAAAEDGLDVVVARPFNHTGPGQDAGFAVPSFARQIAAIEAGQTPDEIHVGNLDARRDLTDVRDVVEAYDRLMDAARTGHAYNVCSGRAWRIGDLLTELVHLARVPVRIVVDQARLRPVDVPVLQGDATRIRADVGWAPRIPVEQTLSDTLDWWRSAVGAPA